MLKYGLSTTGGEPSGFTSDILRHGEEGSRSWKDGAILVEKSGRGTVDRKGTNGIGRKSRGC